MEVFIVFVMANVLFVALATDASSDNSLVLTCDEFIKNNGIRQYIETARDVAPPCPCDEQQMSLDSSFEKTGSCYVQWFFENGVKQMCCYNDEGTLQVGAQNGGYLLLEGANMSFTKQSCCTERDTCDLFYGINQSQNCSSYRPPETVTSWGDPVIQTIDGTEYDFNGHGEYVFLKTCDLEIQARTDYVTPGSKDATEFSAFAFFDSKNGEQIEFHYNKTADDIIIYRSGVNYCNAKRGDDIKQPEPCSRPPKYKCFILAGAGKASILGCSIGDFAQNIEISAPGKFLKLTITKDSRKDIESMNISGLAGKLENGNFVGRYGVHTNENASDYAKFNFSETWALQNEKESRFFYNITGSNYEAYNQNHTVPRFLETLVGNMTELFKGFSPANITLFNNTCRNYWNNEPNKQCLLTIARTKDIELGQAVIREANETRRKWEINNNKSPKFLDGMPTNVSVILKEDIFWTLDLKEYVSDETSGQLNFSVQTSIPTKEYSLENGIFNWTIGPGIRSTNDTEQGLIFLATDRLNFTTRHDVTVRYCGCEQPSECDFDVGDVSSTGKGLQIASCGCLEYYEGTFCEKFVDPCVGVSLKCYGSCNSKLPKSEDSAKSWPCLPCPAGRHEQQFTSGTQSTQSCNDIDECNSREAVCHQGCVNTNGSFICTCEDGFTRDSDGVNCNDINECLDPHACKSKERCVNTPGNYTCKCARGYKRGDTGNCKEIDEKVYVSIISFSVVITPGTVEDFSKEVDNTENRMEIEKTLEKRYDSIPGFVSVEVTKLTLRLQNVGTYRRKRENGLAKHYLDAEYVLHWEGQTNTSTIQKALVTAEGNNAANFIEANGVIDGLRILTRVANVSVNTDICSVQSDCDSASTTCVNLNGSSECKCRVGYERSEYSKTLCKDIDECGLFKENNTLKDRCAHGSCLNIPGSWNCTCPEDRLLQNVGNDSVPVYRCQGNYTYIGNISLVSKIGEKQIEGFVTNQLTSTFGNKSFTEDMQNNIHISSLFVSASVLKFEENNTSLPLRRYDVMFKLRMGEEVDVTRLQNVMTNLCDRHIDNAILSTCHIYNDAENILCNMTSYGGCDKATTSCQQRNGTTNCMCKPGYEKRYATDKFCQDEDECSTRNKTCSGHGRCKNQAGGFTCDCDEGYERNDFDVFNVTCTDIDECQSPDYECVNGQCDNTDGNWTCSCNTTGYDRRKVTSKAVFCEDIDECHDGRYHCGGECINTVGNWTCNCASGFTKYTSTKYRTNDTVVCEDINECHRLDACIDSVCRDLDGSWTCLCQDGTKPKKINDSTIVCTGGYQYVMALGFAVVDPENDKENELEVYLKYLITQVYVASFPDSKVNVEIISVSKDNPGRNKRNAENYKVDFVLHLDEETEVTEIKDVWRSYVTQNCTKWGLCESANKGAANFPFTVLMREDVAVDDSPDAGLCTQEKYNLCDQETTQCKNGNGSIKCECKRGFINESDYKCKVSVDACKDLPCDNGGTCSMKNVGKPEMHFECICAEGWTGKTCAIQNQRRITAPETDLQTVFIATGSTLGGLVIILSAVVLVVCRWRGAKVKEATKLTKRNKENGSFRSLEGSLIDDQYMDDMHNIFNDRIPHNSLRAFPRISSQSDNARHFSEIDTPYFKGSLPNVFHGDAYFYYGNQRRHSLQDDRRFASLGRNFEHDYTFEQNRTFPRHFDRPPSPQPDYNISRNVYNGGNRVNNNRRLGGDFGPSTKF